MPFDVAYIVAGSAANAARTAVAAVPMLTFNARAASRSNSTDTCGTSDDAPLVMLVAPGTLAKAFAIFTAASVGSVFERDETT